MAAGRVKIFKSDAIKFLRRLGDSSVDHVIADPPYLGARGKSWERERVPLRVPYGPATKELLDQLVAEATRIARKRILIFNDYIGERSIRSSLEGMRRTWATAPAPIVWVKPPGAFTPNGTANSPDKRCEFITHAKRRGFKALRILPGAFVSEPYSPKIEILRTGGKPLDLMLCMITAYTDEGDSVVDPFSGAGTTGLACRILGRSALLCDVDEEAVRLSRQRLRRSSAIGLRT